MTSGVEHKGWFWSPDSSEPRVPGILRLSRAEGAELELLGSFSPDAFVGTATAKYPIIFGELHEAAPAGGTRVTLFDTFARSTSWSFAGSKLETLAVNRAYVGDVHVDGPHASFLEARFELRGLDEWMGATVLEAEVRGGEEGPLVKALAPTRRRLTVADAVIELAAGADVHVSGGSQAVRFTRSTLLSVGPTGPATEEIFQRGYLVPLRNLVTLATDRSSAFESVAWVVEDGDPWPVMVHDVTHPAPAAAAEARDELIAFPADDEALSALFGGWLALSARHGRVLDLVFGLLDAPPKLTDMRFELASVALDLVARRIAGLPSASDLVLQMNEASDALAGSAGILVEALASAHGALWDEGPPRGLRLYYLTDAAMWLIKLRLAAEAGVPLATTLRSRAFRRRAEWLRKRIERGAG